MSLNRKYQSYRNSIARAWRTPAAKVILALVVILPLAACNAVTPSPAASSSSSTPGIAVSGGSTPTGAPAPAATASPTTAPTSAPTAAATGTSNAPSAVADAIKSVILKGNQEEVQAIAQQNPNLMSDTSTTSYYNQTVTEVNDLLTAGVTSIKLDKLVWGSITLQSPTTAQATDLETWTTNFTGGGTLQETDQNVYTLVLQNGAWKVQTDAHPNAHTLKPSSPSTSPAPASSSPAPTSPVIPVSPLGAGNSQSQNWSGYAATGGTYTSVSATWTVPNVSTAVDGADATWVGIGGVTSTDLIQAGTSATVQSGQIQYNAWWEILPQSSQTVPMNVNPGDVISVSVTLQSGNTWEIVIQDITAAETYKQTVTYQSSLSSADWIEESPVAGRRLLLPLDNFGTVTFSNASTVVNGKANTIAQAGGKAITMVTGGVALSEPSVLSTKGNSFSVTRTNTVAPRLSSGSGSFQ
ncbi:MAG: G1 family endopeptidase [Chloroflexi bacterium]|nr:G1 family endopeptidase [Chloroflexota bacterium]